MADDPEFTFTREDYERLHALEGAVRILARAVQVLCLKTGSVETYEALYAMTEPEPTPANVVLMRPAASAGIDALARVMLEPIEIERARKPPVESDE